MKVFQVIALTIFLASLPPWLAIMIDSAAGWGWMLLGYSLWSASISMMVVRRATSETPNDDNEDEEEPLRKALMSVALVAAGMGIENCKHTVSMMRKGKGKIVYDIDINCAEFEDVSNASDNGRSS